tara:strand:+ start:4062 stop:4967 length:906 start_codon:yes stop_codon:yes gene_type:complete
LKKLIPSLAVIFAALLWSLDGLLRQGLYTVSTITIVALEHAFGALIFFPFLLKSYKEIQSLSQRGWISIFWITICGGVLGTFFYTKALSYINYIELSVVVLIQKLQPLFAIALSAIILKEKLSNRFIGLALIAIVGGYLATFGINAFIGTWNDKKLIASLLALLSAFCWGSSTVLGKYALKDLSFQTVTGLRLILTALISFIIILLTSNIIEIINLSAFHYYIIIAIVLSTGTVALSIYYYGLQRLPASHTTIFELTWPLSAVFLDWILRGKMLGTIQLLGALLLIISMVLLTRESSNEQV